MSGLGGARVTEERIIQAPRCVVGRELPSLWVRGWKGVRSKQPEVGIGETSRLVALQRDRGSYFWITPGINS